jgi:hypothetical protein
MDIRRITVAIPESETKLSLPQKIFPAGKRLNMVIGGNGKRFSVRALEFR